jgi:poly(3-hydroxybutyrate) depolymerase
MLLGQWRDWSGEDRYVCRWGPQGTREHPLPLVVFLHGSVGAFAADSILLTRLVGMTGSADLGDGPGFVLLAPEGRYISHYYPGFGRTGFGWDNWYRQLDPAGPVTIGGRTYPENPDAAAIDNFIAERTATGTIDTRRIYVMGWSNAAPYQFGLARAYGSV